MQTILLILIGIYTQTALQPSNYSWICDDLHIESGGVSINPIISLDLTVTNGKVAGRMTVRTDGEIVRVSELNGTAYTDGSASLTERWADGVEVAWIPSYNHILITDINASEFRLNYNHANASRASIEKGNCLFRKVHIKGGT